MLLNWTRFYQNKMCDNRLHEYREGSGIPFIKFYR